MATQWTPDARRLFDAALTWLAGSYGQMRFFVERDLVFTLQLQLVELAAAKSGGWRIYNDYPMLPGSRRSLSADLVVINPDGEVEIAAEFKYEPCHRRLDVLKHKLPVTVRADIVKDTARVREFVDRGKTQVGVAICIDEGGYLASRDLGVFGERRRWVGEPNHTHDVDVHLFTYLTT